MRDIDARNPYRDFCPYCGANALSDHGPACPHRPTPFEPWMRLTFSMVGDRLVIERLGSLSRAEALRLAAHIRAEAERGTP